MNERNDNFLTHCKKGDDSYILESTLDMNEILLNVLVFQLPMTAGAA